ncbi:MAG: hypothetical protein GY841_04890 [FCB group bacterium]|nr:hypothetical protein [FCB group bacterium]
MAQLASKVSPKGPKWVHLVPLLRTLEAFLATWGIPLCIFMHFYQVLVNTCAFSMKIHGKYRNIQETALTKINTAPQHIESPNKCAKMRQGETLPNRPQTLSPDEPKWVHLVPLLRTLHAFLATR